MMLIIRSVRQTSLVTPLYLCHYRSKARSNLEGSSTPIDYLDVHNLLCKAVNLAATSHLALFSDTALGIEGGCIRSLELTLISRALSADFSHHLDIFNYVVRILRRQDWRRHYAAEERLWQEIFFWRGRRRLST